MNTTCADPTANDTYDLVVGIDTHAATHTASIIDTYTQHVIHTQSFSTTPAALRRMVAWIHKHTGDTRALVVIEGIGSYGAEIARTAMAAGLQVVEPDRIHTAAVRRGVGKNDAMDAVNIARSVLGTPVERLRRPRGDGERQALRVFLAHRGLLTRHRTALVNALTALLRSLELGIDARRSLNSTQISSIARWRAREEPHWVSQCRQEATRMAQNIEGLDQELKDNLQRINAITTAEVPLLMQEVGVGPVTCAAMLVAWSHHGRLRSEAAFASLAGVSPIPASSGNTCRTRLNRGGDRHLNRALHTVVVVKMNHDPAARAYVAKRIAEGKSKKDAMRCLKRYLARRVFRLLQQRPGVPETP